jgi:hypothetical protein
MPGPLKDQNGREIKHVYDLLMPDVAFISEAIFREFDEIALPISGLKVRIGYPDPKNINNLRGRLNGLKMQSRDHN